MIADERVIYLKTNVSWDEDECVGQSERQTTLQWSVSREFLDADGLRSDRVLKREARLQEISATEPWQSHRRTVLSSKNCSYRK